MNPCNHQTQDQSRSWNSVTAATNAKARSLTCSQQAERTDLTNSLQQASQQRTLPYTEVSIQHRPALSLPTLTHDGSHCSLTSHSSRVYDQTPPAALSSLGQRAKMQRDLHLSESTSSLADSHYDMIDDLSEISNDDHETASLASNDGEVTLNTASDADEDEHVGLVFPSPNVQHSMASVMSDDEQTPSLDSDLDEEEGFKTQRYRKMNEENALIDSIMSDDLETPRQSAVSPKLADVVHSKHSSKLQGLKRHVNPFGNSKQAAKILFVSESDVDPSLMNRICERVATGMKLPSASETTIRRVARLPTPPSGTAADFVDIVDERGEVIAAVQHCFYARTEDANAVSFSVKDGDKCVSFVNTTDYADGKAAKPDIAVLYTSEKSTEIAGWLVLAHEALKTLGIPIITLNAPNNLASHETTQSFLDKDHASMTSYIHAKLSNEPKSRLVKKEALLGSKSQALLTWWKMILALLVAVLPYTLLFGVRFSAYDPMPQLLVRRETLAAALADAVIAPNSPYSLDLEHLLPQSSAECLASDIFGRPIIDAACKQDIRYQGISPNLMIMALPGTRSFPRVLSVEVSKSDGRKITFNRTELIEGVYIIAVDPQEAYGIVSFTMATKTPAMLVKASYNYGSRILQRKTYENAGADFSNAVGKEVAIMKDAATTFTDKLSSELKVSYRATKSVSTELALGVSRDLQIFASHAASAFSKVAKASNGTIKALSKDLIQLQKDLAKVTQDLSTTVTTAAQQAKRQTKTALSYPLARSRDRLVDLRQAFAYRMSLMHRVDGKKSGKYLKHQACGKGKAESSQLALTKSLSILSDNKDLSMGPLADDAMPASRQTQRQVTRAMQQLDRVARHIKRKEQEVRDSGSRAARKELRQLKKDYKQREKALKKLVEGVKRG